MGHSSQGHLRSVMKVLKSFSNCYHQFGSMKGINTENFSPISFLLQFLERFWILQNSQQFLVLYGPIFRKLNLTQEENQGLGNWYYEILLERLTKSHKLKSCFDVTHFIGLLFFGKKQCSQVWWALWKENLVF